MDHGIMKVVTTLPPRSQQQLEVNNASHPTAQYPATTDNTRSSRHFHNPFSNPDCATAMDDRTASVQSDVSPVPRAPNNSMSSPARELPESSRLPLESSRCPYEPDSTRAHKSDIPQTATVPLRIPSQDQGDGDEERRRNRVQPETQRQQQQKQQRHATSQFPRRPQHLDPSTFETAQIPGRVQVVFPPHLPRDPARARRRENWPRERSTGLALRTIPAGQVVDLYSLQTEQITQYAFREQAQRREIYELARVRTEELDHARRRLTVLGYPNDEAAVRFTHGGRKEAEDLQRRALMRQVKSVEDELIDLGDNLRRRQTLTTKFVHGVFDPAGMDPTGNCSAQILLGDRPAIHENGEGGSVGNGFTRSQEYENLSQRARALLYPEKLASLCKGGSGGSGGSSNNNIDVAPPLRIPDWFRAMEALECVPLFAEGTQSRYIELLNNIWRLKNEMGRGGEEEGQERRVGENDDPSAAAPSPRRRPWNKHWHEPSPAWPTQKQRQKGGWWACRTGDAATAAELSCPLCHHPVDDQHQRRQSHNHHNNHHSQGHNTSIVETVEEQYEWVMGKVRRCMGMIADMDKKAVLAQLDLEQSEAQHLMRTDKNWKWKSGFRSQDLTPVGSHADIPCLARLQRRDTTTTEARSA